MFLQACVAVATVSPKKTNVDDEWTHFMAGLRSSGNCEPEENYCG